MRLASTTSNGGSPLGRLPTRARDPARRAGSGGRWPRSPRWRSGRCRRRRPWPPRGARRRWPGCPSHSRRRGRGLRPACPSSASGSSPARHSRVVGWSPVPKAMPGIHGDHDVVGRASMATPGRPDDQPPADAQHREVRLPGVRPVLLVDDPRPQVADGAQPERLQVTERLGHLRGGRLRLAGVTGGHVPANDRRAGRVDARAEALLDEVERRLDGGPAAGHPTEDLADRLDRLEIRLDRELQPGAPPAPPLQRRASRADRHRRPSRRRPWRRPRAARAASWTAWSGPGRRRARGGRPGCCDAGAGAPLPRSRISVSGWVPALISTSSSPSTVGTVMRVPRAAWAIEIGAS